MSNRIYYYFFAICLSAFWGTSSANEPVIDEEPDFYSAPGISSGRIYETTANLDVDTFTGTLQTHSNDMVLSGTGPDIVIQRSYNSVPGLTGYSPLGVGWNIHFGRLVGLYTCSNGNLTIESNRLYFVRPDGKQLEILPENKIYFDNDGNEVYTEGVDYKPEYMTMDFWRAECRGNTFVLTNRNNVDYFFGTDTYRKTYVVRIEDTQQNSIDITYEFFNAYMRPTSVVASDGRYVDFTYGDRFLTSITNGTTNINYVVSNSYLSEVNFPENHSWSYSYKDNTRLLEQVVSPLGAATTITWDNLYFQNKDYPTVTSKCLEQRCWTYSYERSREDGNVSDFTTILTPYFTKEVYIHLTPLSVAHGEIWKIGQLIRKEIYWVAAGSGSSSEITNQCSTEGEINNTETPISTADYTWDYVVVSDKNRTYVKNGVSLIDNAYRKPYLKSSVESKHGETYRYEAQEVTVTADTIQSSNVGNQEKHTQNYYFSDGSRGGNWFVALPQSQYVGLRGSDPGPVTFKYLNGVEYNSEGQIERKFAKGINTYYEYYSNGNVEHVIDGEGNVTTYSSYYRGIARRVDFPDATYITRVVNDEGQITSETNQNGVTTSYQYDDLGRLVYVDLPVSADISVSYSLDHRTKTYIKSNLKEVYRYDEYDNLIEHTSEDLVTAKKLTQSYKYNARNQLTFKSFINDSTKGVHYKYNRLGDLIEVYTSGGGFTTYDINGYSITITDPECHQTTHYYDAFTSSDKWLNEIVAPENVSITIERNELGQPLVINQGNVAREYGYNTNWQLDYYKDPESDVSYSYSYDDAGRKKSEFFHLQSFRFETNYYYDALGRIARIDYPVYYRNNGDMSYFGPDNCPDQSGSMNNCNYTATRKQISFDYDDIGNLTSTTKTESSVWVWGTSISESESSNNWIYSYDDENNLKSETLSYGTRQFPFTYNYDEIGNLSDITYPGNYVVEYAPDSFGRPTKVGNIVNSVEYFDTGPVKTLFYANGRTTSYTLNERQLPATMTVSESGLDYSYHYDLNGNINEISDHLNPSKSNNMAYDGLNRLKTASGVWGQGSFSYDELSNITSKSIGATQSLYAYDSRNRLSSFNGEAFEYDAEGRIMDDGKNKYFYDFSNVLLNTQSLTDSSELNFTYDANNKMIYRDDQGLTDRFAYTQAGKLMYEEQDDGDLKRSHIYLGSKLVAYHDVAIACSDDLDNDGMGHCFERENGLNPYYSNDANEDPDGDNLTNLEEYLNNTSILNPDSDNDGMNDGFEVSYHLDPLTNDSALDPDNDGFSNYEEYVINTDPTVFNSITWPRNLGLSYEPEKVIVTWNEVQFADQYDLYWGHTLDANADEGENLVTYQLIENVTSPHVVDVEAFAGHELVFMVAAKKGDHYSVGRTETIRATNKHWAATKPGPYSWNNMDIDLAGNTYFLTSYDSHRSTEFVSDGVYVEGTRFPQKQLFDYVAKDFAINVSDNGFICVAAVSENESDINLAIYNPNEELAERQWKTDTLDGDSVVNGNFSIASSENGHFVISWVEMLSHPVRKLARWNPATGWGDPISIDYEVNDIAYISEKTNDVLSLSINNSGQVALALRMNHHEISTAPETFGEQIWIDTIHLMTMDSEGNLARETINTLEEDFRAAIELNNEGQGLLVWEGSASQQFQSIRFDVSNGRTEAIPVATVPGNLSLIDAVLKTDGLAVLFFENNGRLQFASQEPGNDWVVSGVSSIDIANIRTTATELYNGDIQLAIRLTDENATHFLQMVKLTQGELELIETTQASASIMGYTPFNKVGEMARLDANSTSAPDGSLFHIESPKVFAYQSNRISSEKPWASAISKVVTPGTIPSLEAHYSDNGGIVSVDWSQVSGPSVEIISVDGVNRFRVPNAPDEVVVLQVVVTDDEGLTATDTAKYRIGNPSNTPVADAGPDQVFMGKEGTIVRLCEGDSLGGTENPIDYVEWQQLSGPPVTLNDYVQGFDIPCSLSGAKQFAIPAITDDVDLRFQLSIYSTDGQADTDEVVIALRKTTAPEADFFGGNQEIAAGQVANFGFTNARDPDGGDVRMPDIVIEDSTSMTPYPKQGLSPHLWEFTAPAVEVETVYSYTLYIEDDEEQEAAYPVTITVRPGSVVNEPPTAHAGANQNAVEGSTVQLDGSRSSAPDGETLTSYVWQQVSGPSVELSDSSAISPSFTAPDVTTDTTLEFSLTVTASNGRTDQSSISIVIQDVPVVTDIQVELVGNDGKWKKDGDNGGLITYIARVSNNTDTSAENVALTNSFPSQVSIVSVTPAMGTCSGNESCNLGTLSANQSVDVEVVVRAATKDDKYDYTSSVSTSMNDSDINNNSDTKQFGGSLGYILLAMVALLTRRFQSGLSLYRSLRKAFRSSCKLEQWASQSLLATLLIAFSFTAQGAEESITYIHTDHLGSPVLATNQNGSVKWREDYQPFGKQLINEDSGNKVGFTGHQDDKTLGLTYMQGRWYHPEAGRFTGLDPVLFVEGNLLSVNRYAYANNNPYRYTDPTGKIPVDTLWDFGNVTYDVVKITIGYATGNHQMVVDGTIDLAADSIALAVPYLPAGSTKALGVGTKSVTKKADADFIVSPKGTAMSTKKDYNLVDTKQENGDWFQIHNTHGHGDLGKTHTHFPEQHGQRRVRRDRKTNGSDMDFADQKLRDGSMRERTGRKDKGG